MLIGELGEEVQDIEKPLILITIGHIWTAQLERYTAVPATVSDTDQSDGACLPIPFPYIVKIFRSLTSCRRVCGPTQRAGYRRVEGHFAIEGAISVRRSA